MTLTALVQQKTSTMK